MNIFFVETDFNFNFPNLFEIAIFCNIMNVCTVWNGMYGSPFPPQKITTVIVTFYLVI